MRRSRGIGLVGALVVLITGAAWTGATVGAAAASRPPRRATDVGITPTTIRIAVLADVDNPAAPGLFQGSVSAVEGWAKYMNSIGGLAGRKVVVDFIDTHLSDSDAAKRHHHRRASSDFALVGTERALRRTASPTWSGARTRRSGDRAAGLPRGADRAGPPVLTGVVLGGGRDPRLRDEERQPPDLRGDGRPGPLLPEPLQGPARHLRLPVGPAGLEERPGAAVQDPAGARHQAGRGVRHLGRGAPKRLHAGGAGRQAGRVDVRPPRSRRTAARWRSARKPTCRASRR